MEDLLADVIYIRLHGLSGQPYLYGDPGWQTALSAEQVSAADFTGSKVFMEGCYGQTIADAFLSAGAECVVGNTTTTWGRRFTLGPSSKVGKAWLNELYAGNTAKQSLKKAIKKVKEPYNLGWHVWENGESI